MLPTLMPEPAWGCGRRQNDPTRHDAQHAGLRMPHVSSSESLTDNAPPMSFCVDSTPAIPLDLTKTSTTTSWNIAT